MLRNVICFALVAIRLVDGLTKDLIDDCCNRKCGRFAQPLIINSNGLDKTADQMSELTITSNGVALNLNPGHSNGTYCLISVYTEDYVMLNLSYFIEPIEEKRAVVIMDTSPVAAKETGEFIDGKMDRKDAYAEAYSINTQDNKEKQAVEDDSTPGSRLKGYQLQNFRISPQRLFTIGVAIDALKEGKVQYLAATFVADSGTAGRTFFIILGVVVLVFVIGVPGSFACYRRYFKKKNSNRGIQPHQIVRFSAAENEAQYVGSQGTSTHRTPSGTSRDSTTPLTAPVVQRRRLSLADKIRKVTNRNKDNGNPTANLPKHKLLTKQELRRTLPRPLHIVGPMSQNREYAFPGVNPGCEKDNPPQAVERPLQTARSRVVSHSRISEEEIYQDTETSFTREASEV